MVTNPTPTAEATNEDDISQLIEYHRILQGMPDSRQSGKVKFTLSNLLLFSLAAVLSGHDSFVLMALWTIRNGARLLEQLNLPPLPSMPSHDTFRTVLSLLNPDKLEGLLREAVSAAQGSDQPLRGQLVIFDGKAQRGTRGPKAKKGSALMVLNAYAPTLGMTVGTTMVPESTNETAQLPALIESLNLEGATVCIDAAGTYKPVAQAIVNQKADYVLTLRENQPKLFGAVEVFFDLLDQRTEGQPMPKDIRTVSLHSLSKCREVSLTLESCDWLDWLPQREEWSGLKAVARMIRHRVDEQGQEHHTTTYLMSSRRSAKAILAASHGRWAIENTLHWTLDVSFREDACRIRDDTAVHNMAILRRLSYNLLKSAVYPAIKDLSIKGKRIACGDMPFLIKVLAQLNVHA
jgi:predicted transposase YbfD/YdcC